MVWWRLYAKAGRPLTPGKRLGTKSGGTHLRCQKCKVCLADGHKCLADQHHERSIMCIKCFNA